MWCCSHQDTGNWGCKLKLDVSKPILGLTLHPTDPGLVMLLHADGAIRGYAAATPATSPLEGATLAPVFSHQGEGAVRAAALGPVSSPLGEHQ
jgi:hypothetical protein